MALDLAAILDAWNAVFNANDLDGVMTYFAPDAIYRPGDGTEHRGLAAIRAAFAPQFAGRLGAMRFDLEDTLIDREARKATTRWICRHDLRGERGRAVPTWLRLMIRARYGERVGWRGVDVFHFDLAGKFTGKFTYANYDRPQLRRDLGA
ncbi:MAG: nuclear transport factor 2 family protein [Deltaproteobacteria bacterium]|nr:nuclear transport factor 2 family protein [Deltaproteobacteria bacterium]